MKARSTESAPTRTEDDTMIDSSYVDFSGQVVLITGGSRGLGLAMASTFAANGAHVIVSSRKVDACKAAAAEIRATGGSASAIACHAGEWQSLDTLVQRALAEQGRIDVLINNAGMAPTAPRSVDMTEALFDKIVAVNFKGPFRLSALVAEEMKQRGGGAIVNITSTGAIKPEPSFNVYAASKGALNIMTRSQAMEFGPSVRVNAIMAGPFWTDMSKSWREQADRESTAAMQRIGRPHEIVSTAMYLASPASSFTTGTIIQLDGGVL
jgi:NAD(P)-dependent dehydrogenase (short-subunit alcohol dehydrogenase family)